jgi:hypothetical protein
VPVGASAIPLRNSALEIGRGSVIAAGAAVVRDVPRLGKVATPACVPSGEYSASRVTQGPLEILVRPLRRNLSICDVIRM